MPGIEIKNLKKSFGNFDAIREMSLTIPDGAFCVFLGPSGCGKSTTLNIVAGLDNATSGTISIAGRDVTALAPHERDIAMVFQSSLLYPHLTALQNIQMSLRNTDTPAAEAASRIEHAIDILEIKSVLNKKPGAMSGGQRQRVAMAKAIVRKPAAFLMDEPLAALDAALRQSLRSELVALQKRLGTTTIFVTHDQVEAMTMGDMIVVMNAGAIEQVGTPDEIYNAPATKFVAGFIGSPPMNFFDGVISMAAGEPELATDAGIVKIPPHLRDRVSGNGAKHSLAVRPQHMQISRTSQERSIPATVFVVENLGKESVIILNDTAGKDYRVLAAPDHGYVRGDSAFLVPDLDRALLFSE